MKTVFTNRELPHLWAHQTQSQGFNAKRSLHFSGPSYYSYSTEIGRIIERKGCKAYLINDTKYSVTTTQHQSRMRSAIPSDATVFSLGAMGRGSMPDTKSLGPMLFVYAINRYAHHAAKHKRCRQSWSKDYEASQQAKWLARAAEVNKFFGLRRKVDEKVIERLSAAAERDRKRRDKEEEARQAKLEAQKKEQLEAWLSGSPFPFPYGIQKVYLRRITHPRGATDEQMMETSRGVTVPIEDAERAFRFARKVAHRRRCACGHVGPEAICPECKGTTLYVGWRRNGEECKVGSYQLDSVGPDGVVAGCHHISWSELTRFAKSVGWLDENQIRDADSDSQVVKTSEEQKQNAPPV